MAQVPNTEPEAKSHLAEDEDDSDQPQEPASAKAVPPTAAVITIEGFCRPTQSSTNSARACKTRISRTEFEKFATSMQPKPNMALKLQFAQAYPKLVVMSAKAKEEGLDKQESFAVRMDYAEMQLLTQALLQKIQADAEKISETEIAAYYRENRKAFQEFTFQRIVVPLQGRNSPAGSAEKLTALATELRSRAVAGEDFVKLQREALEAAGVHVESPNITMNKIRRTNVPRTHLSIFDLKEGQVSEVITDQGGHYVYRMIAVNQLLLRQARGEIKAKIKDDRVKEALAEVQNSYRVEINPQYFGAQPAGTSK